MAGRIGLLYSVSAEILLSFGVNHLKNKRVGLTFYNGNSDPITVSFSVPGGNMDGLDLMCLSCWTGVRKVTPAVVFTQLVEREATGTSTALVLCKNSFTWSNNSREGVKC